ncbi:16S rRNA processing protein RimM, partial [bacterium]
MSERLVPLGEIVTTHGIDGWLKLKPYNPQITTLASNREIFLEKGGACSPHWLQAMKPHKGHLLLHLRGIDGIGAAEKWVGAILSVAEEALQPLGPGEYYYYQMVGLDVYDTHGEWIGIITRIWSKEGGDL